MDESYDRIVRDWAELVRWREYIAGNPAKAGLHPGHYRLGTMSTLTFEANSEPESGGTPEPLTGLKPVPPFPLCNIQDHDDWKKLPGKIVYPGKYIQVEECSYLTPARPDTPVPWTVAHRKSAIAVAPITHDGKFILIHQERLPVQRTLWEFPAGQLDDGETHAEIIATVHRELDEEAGCEIASDGTLSPLGWFFGSQGFTNEHVYLFAAHPVRIVRTPQPVGGEHIGEVRLVTGAELRQMVASHVIQDALTLALFARMTAHGML
jgi:ADP-ribose pyrophosphatase